MSRRNRVHNTTRPFFLSPWPMMARCSSCPRRRVSVYAVIPSYLPAHGDVDRLPTVSASQALQEIRTKAKKSISTGLESLDQLFVPQLGRQSSPVFGGLPLGRLTEVYGPPGIGKSTFWYVLRPMHG